MAKPVLGRGLGALLGGASAAPKAAAATSPPPAASRRKRCGRTCATCAGRQGSPLPFSAAQGFFSESLRELADSIKEQGIVQPLIVRAQGGNFELIAGERRWRAAQMLGLAEVPVIVRRSG